MRASTLHVQAPAVKPEIIAFGSGVIGAELAGAEGLLRNRASSHPSSTPARRTDSRRSRRHRQPLPSARLRADGMHWHAARRAQLGPLRAPADRAPESRQDVVSLSASSSAAVPRPQQADRRFHRNVSRERRQTALASECQRRSRFKVQPSVRLDARSCSPRACHETTSFVDGDRSAAAESLSRFSSSNAIRPPARRRRRRTFARRDGGARTDGNSSRQSVQARILFRDGTIRCVSAPRLILASTSRYRRERAESASSVLRS